MDENSVCERSFEEKERSVQKNFWTVFMKAMRHIPFVEDLVAGYYCAFDKETPMRVRVILISALAYFVLPFDTIPDFIIGLGFTDDIGVLLLALNSVRASLKSHHYEAARRALERLA